MFCFYYNNKELSLIYCPRIYRQNMYIHSFDISYINYLNKTIKIVNKYLLNHDFRAKASESAYLERNFKIFDYSLSPILYDDLHLTVSAQIENFLYDYKFKELKKTNYFNEFKSFCHDQVYDLFFAPYNVINKRA